MSSETPADRGGSSSPDGTRSRPALTDRDADAGTPATGDTVPERHLPPQDQSSELPDTPTGTGQAEPGGGRPDPLAAAEEAVDSGAADRLADEQSEVDPAAARRGAGGKEPWAGRRRGRKGGRGGEEPVPKNTPGLPTRRQRFRVLQGMGPMEPRPEIPDQSHLPPEKRTDLAVRVQHLHITYRTSFEKKPTMRQAVMRLGRGQRAVREVQALKDISFEVRTGTAMGIIGRNGAGKSTLMRAMAGILPPTSGTVEVWGRASTLLALGVGFNNSLSGRENIILGGLAAGLSRAEVEERANEIAEWTELGDFIDMPMRSYSSGMFSRVAFSVAVHMEPDILMIDEALSTGDAHFREKASAKMAELRSRSRAMFLVSHGLGSIKELCDEAIWIDKGRLMERGDPEAVVEAYLKHVGARSSATNEEDI